MDTLLSFVKVLTEASPDNLFVLIGLAFLVIAVVGDIWKFQPGKGGRILAAVLGPMLIVAGLALHARHIYAPADNSTVQTRHP